MYTVPSKAIAAAKDGNTILIDAGTYTDDFAVITANNLTIRGVGGKARLVQSSNGVIPSGKAIWVTSGSNITIDNVEFSGAHVSDGNGAGIRAEGAGLIVTNSYFHDSENGILASANSSSDIDIEYSEFANNGVGGDGHTHNVYIGTVRSLTFKYDYSHSSNVGHLVKSRALKNVIAYNRLTDELGTGSYEVDLPDGGESYVIGNMIEQGPNTGNPSIIAYAEESTSNPTQQLYVSGNTIVNDRSAGGTFIWVTGTPTTKITDNLFVGTGTLVSGATLNSGNVTTTNPGFVNQAGYDYHLTASSPAIDKGVDAGNANGMNLNPTMEYVHPLSSKVRTVSGTAIDAGAFEYASLIISNPVPTATLSVSPTSITQGGVATITWTSTNATSCTGSGFSTSGTSGFTAVTPSQTTTYSLTCTGTGGTSPVSSATTTVSMPTPAPSSTITLDASTPAAVNGVGTLTTTTFTPPAGSIVVIMVASDENSSTQTFTISDNRSSSLAYANIGSGPYGASLNDARVQAWWAAVPSASPMTITLKPAQANLQKLLRVLVFTGANATNPIGAVVGGAGVTGALNQSYTAIAAGSLGVAVYSDWTQKGVPTVPSSEIVDTSYDPAGLFTGAIIRQSAPTPTAGTHVNCSTLSPSSGTRVAWMCLELVPATTQAQANNLSYMAATALLGANQLNVGTVVRTTSNLNVRQTPGFSGTLVSTRPSGSLGTIVVGSTTVDGHTWWQVHYANGALGWSIDDYLSRAQ